MSIRPLFLSVVALVLLPSCASTAQSNSAECGRNCLGDHLTGYLSGLEKHRIADLKLASVYRATENGTEVPMGNGLAKSVTALGNVQRRYFDPVTGQAAYLGTVREGAETALVAIRIRIDRGEILESETFVARKGDALFSPEGFSTLPPREPAPLPASKRRPRTEMISVANAYFEGLATHDSAKVPRIKGCDRLENGTRVTNRPPREAPAPGAPAVEFGATDCGSGLERMTQIASVAHRRFPLVDEQAGVVMGVGLFLRPPGQTGNFAKRNLLTEFFQMEEGKLSGIYAVMHYVDAEFPDGTGWK
jgi:hypothetical protein